MAGVGLSLLLIGGPLLAATGISTPTYETTQALVEAQTHANRHIAAVEIYWAFDVEKPYEGLELRPIELIFEEYIKTFYIERVAHKEQAETQQDIEKKTPETPVNNEEYNSEAAEPKAGKLSTQADKDYSEGINGSAYTINVSDLVQGEPTVDLGSVTIMVGDVPITNIFEQSTNPDQGNIDLVDRRTLVPEEQTIIPASHASNDDIYTVNNLG